jgi:hypothetical protein
LRAAVTFAHPENAAMIQSVEDLSDGTLSSVSFHRHAVVAIAPSNRLR